MKKKEFTILIVDDNTATVRILSYILKREGYKVLEAMTGTDGLRLVKERNPDLLLLDVFLPDMNGVEICRQIKNNPDLKHILVVLISGIEIERKSQVHGLDAGAEGYLVKPVSKQVLLAYVRLMERIKRNENELRGAAEILDKRVKQRTKKLETVNKKLLNEISERKEIEKILASKEEHYRMLFLNNPIPLWVYDRDTLAFLAVNGAAVQQYGYSAEEFLSMTFKDIHCEWEESIVHQSLAPGGEALRKAGSFRHRKKDGTIIDVEITTHDLIFEGKQARLVMATDITLRKRAEEAVRDSEERFRMIFENVFDGICIYTNDPDPYKRKLVECNERYASMAGRTRDELLQHESTQDLQRTLEESANANRMESLARGDVYQGFFSWIRPDGKENIVEYTGVPITWQGEPYSIGIDRDITEQKRAERALRESEKKYRDIVTWAPIGIYQSTRSGEMISANSSIAKLLGCDNVDELIGCNMGQSIYYDDEDRKRFIAQHDASGENVALSFETRWRKKDGSIVWVLMTVHDLRDKSGEILYYEGFVFDITERKYAEEALRESEERYRLLVENSTDLVIEIDADGKFLYISPNVKLILGFEPADLVGTSVLSRIYGKDKSLMKEILKKQGGNVMYRYGNNLGIWHWFESSGRVYNTSSGERRMVMVSRDITQRRKAEQELDLSRKQLQHFTEHLEQVLEEERKRISRELHDELGQLLTILKFDLSWLRLEGVKDSTDVLMKIDGMMDALNEALASVKRISKEIRPPQLEALGLGGSIQWDIDQVEKKTGLKGMVTIEPAELEVKAQIGEVLYRVFREALTNIVRHAQAEHVYVRLTRRLDSIILTIRDDGRGITKKEQTNTTTLGLVGIRERIRTISGTLALEGKSGKGTMLSVEVPLKKKRNGDRKS